MRRLVYIVIVMVGMLAAAPAVLAAESQFYFVGKVVTSSDPVPGARHIYLRWDPVEVQLPADIVEIRLQRNGEVVGTWPSNAVMTAAQIDALYRGGDHQRRKLETITRLNEIAGDQGQAFSPSAFADTLHQLINPALLDTYNPLWAFLGSRTDFNIARARHRAWIDTTPVTAENRSVVEYELLGANSGGATVRLGYLEIDPTTTQSVLGAQQLEQLRVSDMRCDLPEGAKDHFTVMLNWEAPGANNVADRMAAQSYISGFDLYRTTENLGPSESSAPPRDIASLAAAASYDSRGRPRIDGLEKVNVALIFDPGAQSIDADWIAARQYHLERVGGDPRELPVVPEENIPYEPKWVEARDQLMRAGLRPGDRRAYYLVPRDFTGNYGPTVGTVVEVPLMTRPPAPWNLRSFADQTSSTLGGTDSLTFTWDEVNLDSYVKMYQGTRLFCNTVEARTTGVLEYVPAGADCATSPRHAVRLDVRDYRIYRFENFDVAGRFKDSDGDGVEDSAETPDIDGNDRIDAFERSVGLQCNALLQPPGVENYLVYGSGAGSVTLSRPSILNPNSPEIVRMFDTVPEGNKDTVYWYRIVSEATTPAPFGRLSFMSAPQRGMFPDRTPPPEPVVSVQKPGFEPQGCSVETTPNVPWSFEEQVLDDEKQTFMVSCGTQTYTANTGQLGNANSVQCQQIAQACAGQQVALSTPASSKTGNKSCSANIAAEPGFEFCSTGAVNVVPDLVGALVDALPGDLVPGGVLVSSAPPPPDARGSYCVSVFESIDGTTTRLGSTCDPGGLQFTPRPGLFCGYAVATDENNNFSRTVQFPCVLTPPQPKAPSPPQILTFDVDDVRARFTMRLPAEQTAMVLAKLDHETRTPDSTSTMKSVPVIDNEPGESISVSIPVESLQASQDRFCLRAMSVGRDTGAGVAENSEWSRETCFTRTAQGEDVPQYLPWPEVKGATLGLPLNAALVTDYYDFLPFLMFRLARTTQHLADGSELSHCWAIPPEDAATNRSEFDAYNCWEAGYASFKAFLEPKLGFILYRQSRYLGGPTSDWIQVSPLIDYAHFDRQIVQISDNDYRLWTLNDPFIKVVPDANDPTALDVLFVDRYPFRRSLDADGALPFEWRYQLVYFDSNHLPVEYRVSDWFAEGSL